MKSPPLLAALDWRISILVVFVVAVVAGMQWFATRWGAGISPDSVQYIDGSMGLIEGRGYSTVGGDGSSTPIVLWPPFYSFILAVPGSLASDPASFARLLNVAMLAISAALTGAMVYRHARGSSLHLGVALALIMLSPNLLRAHSWAWSEPIYIALLLSSMLSLNHGLMRSTKRWLLLGAALLSLAALTRYAGAGLILAGSACILLFSRQRMALRLENSVHFLAVAMLPVSAWLLRNSWVAGTLVLRTLKPRGLYAVHFLPLVETIGGWIFPWSDDLGIQALGVGILMLTGATVAFGYIRSLIGQSAKPQQASPERSYVPEICLLFAGAEIIIILGSKLLLDPLLPLDGRLFLPSYVAVVIGLVCASCDLSATQLGKVALPLACTVAIIAIAGSIPSSLTWAGRAHDNGLGYNSVSWRTSSLVAYVRDLGPDSVIYSNADDGLRFRTGKPVYRLPDAFGVAFGQSEQDFLRQTDALKEAMERGALIVYFDAVTWRLTASIEFLRPYLPLEPVYEAEEGAVYRLHRSLDAAS